MLKPSRIRYLMPRYAYDARLEGVTPHTLRHIFGRTLVDAGTPVDRVASPMGHESATPAGSTPDPLFKICSRRLRRLR